MNQWRNTCIFTNVIGWISVKKLHLCEPGLRCMHSCPMLKDNPKALKTRQANHSLFSPRKLQPIQYFVRRKEGTMYCTRCSTGTTVASPRYLSKCRLYAHFRAYYCSTFKTAYQEHLLYARNYCTGCTNFTLCKWVLNSPTWGSWKISLLGLEYFFLVLCDVIYQVASLSTKRYQISLAFIFLTRTFPRFSISNNSDAF